MPRPSDQGGTPEEPEARFRRLYEEHGRSVFGFFRRKGFSDEDSRELTQETFMRVYQGLNEFRGASSERTWVFSIARNLLLNLHRDATAKKRLHTEVPLDGPGPGQDGGSTVVDSVADPGAGDPLAETLAGERRRLLREAIAALPPGMRRCVYLRVVQERKYREIAAILGISIDTVKSHLHQAKARLGPLLEEHFRGPDRLGPDEGGTP